tara:strand:+ start:147 stop:326 length:180 start_codon:yes stop_codon:yes gene_type:complete
MEEKFKTNEILDAVNYLLKKDKVETLILKKEFKIKTSNMLPQDTEKIISQAEKYMKKKT